MKHQIVFNDIDLSCRIAHDVDQHLCLVAQQVREELARRSKRLARLDSCPQSIERFERRRSRAHQHPAIDVEGHRRGRRRLEREERHIVQDREQGVAGGFDARAGAQSEQIVEITGQVEVLGEPAL